jgi:hypothetical protein
VREERRREIGERETYIHVTSRFEFEKALCEPHDFESCHIVLECVVKSSDMPPIRMLIRGEIDSQLPTGISISPSLSSLPSPAFPLLTHAQK